MYTKYDYFAFIDDLSIYSETGKIIHLTKREYTYYKSQGLNDSDIKVMLYEYINDLDSDMIVSPVLSKH